MAKRSLRKPKPTEKAAQAAAMKAKAKLQAIRRKSSSSPSKSSSTDKKKRTLVKSEPVEVETIDISSDDNVGDEDNSTQDTSESDAMVDSDDDNEGPSNSQPVKEDLDTYEASFIDDEEMSENADSSDESPSLSKGKGKTLVADSDVEEIETPVVITPKRRHRIGKERSAKIPSPMWKKSSGTVKRSLPNAEEVTVDPKRTSSKKKKTSASGDVSKAFNADDLQLEDLLNALHKKAQDKSISDDPRVQRILQASQESAKSSGALKKKVSSEESTPGGAGSTPRTPVKKQKQRDSMVIATPRSALADSLQSLVVEGQKTIEQALEPDVTLDMENLIPLPYLSDYVNDTAVVSWTESVLHYYPRLTAAHRDKLTALVSTPTFGPEGEIHNLAFQDPRNFCVIAEPGALSNTTVHTMKELLPDATEDDLLYRDCAFVSFGQITNSTLRTPSQLGSSGLFNRAVYLGEIRHIWDRKFSAAYSIMAKYYQSDTQYTKPTLEDLDMRTYYHGVQYATAVEPAPAGSSAVNLPPGAILQVGKDKYLPANRATWYEDVFKPSMRRATLPTHNNRVPVFDACHIFQGSDVAHHWDFEDIATVCDIHEGDIPNRSLVAVLHSIHRTYVKAGNRMYLQFGVYAIVILCKASQREQDKRW